MTTAERKIFIIDDDEFLLDMYSTKFRESAFVVETAAGADDALSKIRNGLLPDIVLLDIVMPKMDGFALLEIIRKENLIPNSKIIFLSNLGQKDHLDKGFKLGADDYIVKAYFTPSEVVKKVEAVLSGASRYKKTGLAQ